MTNVDEWIATLTPCSYWPHDYYILLTIKNIPFQLEDLI